MQSERDQYFIMNLLWGAFMFSVVIYGVVSVMLTEGSVVGSLWQDTMAQILWIVAGASALGSVALAQWHPPETMQNGMFLKFLYRAMLAESVAIFGLVLVFLLADVRHMFALGAVSLALHVANKP